MTERNRDRNRSEDEEQAMKNVSHTHPFTGESFGGVYQRGPAVTDGGATATQKPEQGTAMRDVSHTSPYGEDANTVWARGDEPVPERRSDVDE